MSPEALELMLPDPSGRESLGDAVVTARVERRVDRVENLF